MWVGQRPWTPHIKLFRYSSSCALSCPVMICEHSAGPRMLSRFNHMSLHVWEWTFVLLCKPALLQKEFICIEVSNASKFELNSCAAYELSLCFMHNYYLCVSCIMTISCSTSILHALTAYNCMHLHVLKWFEGLNAYAHTKCWEVAALYRELWVCEQHVSRAQSVAAYAWLYWKQGMYVSGLRVWLHVIARIDSWACVCLWWHV